MRKLLHLPSFRQNFEAQAFQLLRLVDLGGGNLWLHFISLGVVLGALVELDVEAIGKQL